MPFRRPVTAVVGKPLPVPKITMGMDDSAISAAVNELHAKYVEALVALFDASKAQHGCPNATLEIF